MESPGLGEGVCGIVRRAGNWGVEESFARSTVMTMGVLCHNRRVSASVPVSRHELRGAWWYYV